MKKYFIIGLVWALSWPVNAQDTGPDNISTQDFEQIVQKLFDMQNQLLKQMRDTTLSGFAPQSFLKFYNFPQGDPQELSPEEWQEWMKKGWTDLDSMGTQNPFGKFDMESFFKMIPDSLSSGMLHLEPFFGEGFKFPEGIENKDKNKKRKVYSL